MKVLVLVPLYRKVWQFDRGHRELTQTESVKNRNPNNSSSTTRIKRTTSKKAKKTKRLYSIVQKR